MTKEQIKKMTVEQKSLKVYNDMAKKKFSSIEEACKFYKFAPASYYLHAKKFKRLEQLVTAGIQSEEELPKEPVTAKTWMEEIRVLRTENEKLKKDFETERMRNFRLSQKLVSFILGEVTA